nr:WAT1-related protein At2g37460-like [Tanacetum cinerariifolium]
PPPPSIIIPTTKPAHHHHYQAPPLPPALPTTVINHRPHSPPLPQTTTTTTNHQPILNSSFYFDHMRKQSESKLLGLAIEAVFGSDGGGRIGWGTKIDGGGGGIGLSGRDINSKVTLNERMSNYVFVVYRLAVATVVMALFAIVLDRNTRPKMTKSVFIKLLLLALLEPVIGQIFYFLGMKATTATFSVAMCNVLPAITFVMAFILSKTAPKPLSDASKYTTKSFDPLGNAKIVTIPGPKSSDGNVFLPNMELMIARSQVDLQIYA